MTVRISRRQFIRTATLSAAALALPGAAAAAALGPAGAVAVDRTRFPQSVASGDPRPDRVLLWTRVSAGPGPLRLLLQAGADADFDGPLVERELHADPAHDHCVRVRLTGLEPGQVLHYRFLLETGAGWVASPTGRTRSAPAPDADVAARFAFMSCQDYGGRWYNALLPLLEEELDFLLHLGDFIYETVGDPGFQSQGGERTIVFDDAAGALPLGDADHRYHAARSLDNYRQLHRTVRTDPVLQQLLERAPLVAIWDDHEFADDSWQDNATHTDGRVDEADRERRRNAEQAWLEYLPVDHDDGLGDDAHPPREALFPNLRIWRRLRWGRHLDLFLTDTRSERPDHLVPEDAFPGTILHDREELQRLLPEVGVDPASVEDVLVPWVDLDRPGREWVRKAVRRVLLEGYKAEGLEEAEARRLAEAAACGRMARPAVDAAVAQWNAHAPAIMRVTPLAADAVDGKGLAWMSVGKTGLFGSIGSRYMVVANSYAALAALREAEGAYAPMSPRQRQWLASGLQGSDASWKTVASSISMTPIVLDLSDPRLQAPAVLRRRFLLNVDHWDGFPNARQALLDGAFASAGNVVTLSGDIHAAFVSQHGARAVEFTVPAVSSSTLADIIAAQAQGNAEAEEATMRLLGTLDALVLSGDPRVREAQTRVHGVCLARVDGRAFHVELLTLPPALCRERLYEAPARVQAQLRRQSFTVDAADGQVRETL